MREVIEHLRKVKGLNGQNVIGYHGTSLESVEYIVENGVLLGRAYAPEESYEPVKGSLSFHPIKGRIEHELEDTFLEEYEAFERVAIYAEIIARRHAFLKRMDLDLGDENRDYDAVVLTDDWDSHELRTTFARYVEEGFSQQKLRSAISFAQKRKGFVLGLSEKLIDFNLEEGDKNEGDLQIYCPDGLPYNLISSVIPLGEIEEEYLDGLE